ncbi:MAG: cyclase, partial [Chloroflexota bacterium]
MAQTSGSWLGQAVRIFDLEQPRYQGMPIHEAHQPGYLYALHRRHRDTYRPEVTGPRSGASGVIVCMEHSGTHIDAICHQAEDLKLFENIPAAEVESPRGFSRLAVEEIPPLVGPGALLDVAGYKGVEALEPGYAVTVADLEACCAAQGVEIRPGDVVLVRTG